MGYEEASSHGRVVCDLGIFVFRVLSTTVIRIYLVRNAGPLVKEGAVQWTENRQPEGIIVMISLGFLFFFPFFDYSRCGTGDNANAVGEDENDVFWC